MAEIKCPICGNENSENAAECIFCGAVLNRSLKQTWRKPSPDSVEEMLADLRGADETKLQPEEQANDMEPASGEINEEQISEDFINRLRDFALDQDSQLGETMDEEGDNLPDWLKELDNWQPPADQTVDQDVVPPSIEPSDLPVDENIIPPWIDSTESDEVTPEPAETPEVYPSDAIKAEVLSDWLASQKLQKSISEESSQAEDEENQPEAIIELPPGLADQETNDDGDISVEIVEQPEMDEQEATDIPINEELPEEESAEEAEEEPEQEIGQETGEDTVEEISDAVSEEDENEIPSSSGTGFDYPGDAESISVSEGDNLNEWLGNLQESNFPQIFSTADEEAEEEPSNATPPFVSEDLEAWMQSDSREPEIQGSIDEEENIPVPEETQPEWIQDLVPEKEQDSTPSEELHEDEEFPEAEIPAWLASLQPIDGNLPAALTPEPADVTEEVGPLAGISGVLPVIEATAFFRKPPLYSSHVELTEKQRSNVTRLENMLEEDKQTAKRKRFVRRTPHGLIRTIIGILLIAVMMLPQIMPLSTELKSFIGNAGSTESGSFLSAIDALPEGSTVLLAIEYLPGYEGELSTAAKSTIEMLMKRNAHIAVVSTNASGPVLADGLINDVLANNPDLQIQYSQRDWYINLGYLPGETLSLQELTSSPKKAVQYGLNAGMENRLVWDSAGLVNIHNIQDFSMLILLADTIETARVWVEQVQPSIVNMPFLIVSSAQATPMIQPYVDSGQVQGLVSGLAGGLSMADSNQPATESTGKEWMMYQLGVAVIIVLILFGILIEFIKSLFGRKRLDQEAS